MDKLKMHTPNKADENFAKLAAMFPNAVTETIDENGEVVRAIDKDVLMQEISTKVVDGKEERYQFTWPDKKQALLTANAPIAKTLRPCREESIDFDTTENLYIEGDNLEVLKLLQETYLHKIKMIYIDPPYNTGNDFIYTDDFSQSPDEYMDNSGQFDCEGNRLVKNLDTNGRYHTNWLNMIFPRLKLSKDLLSDDGVIFISIDDNEQDNIKKCCDEVFGASNYIGSLSVENNPKGRKNSSFISVSSEYCIIYAKDKTASHFIENIPKKATDMTMDVNGHYVHNSGKRVIVGENSFNNIVTRVSSEKNYSVYYRSSDEQVRLVTEDYRTVDEELVREGYAKYYSFYDGKLRENTYTKSKFLELFETKSLDFSNGKIYEKNFNDTIRIKSQLINREYEAIVNGQKKMYSMELTTTGAGTYVKNLFGTENAPFSAPKNIGFLKLLISLFENEDFTVLDFFSGSSTTADAVMHLNSEDNGCRKFIMVQLPENLDENLVKASSLEKPIIKQAIEICDGLNVPHLLTEVAKERIRRAGAKIKEEKGLTAQNLDIGFRVLKCDDTNMKDVYYNPAEFEPSLFDKVTDNIKEDRTPEDLLFQVMLDLGVFLSSKVEESTIDGKKVFNVADGFLIACFDDKVTDETVKTIAKQKPYYAVFRDSGMATDSVATNFEQIFATYSPDTVRKVL